MHVLDPVDTPPPKAVVLLDQTWGKPACLWNMGSL